jgi:hypothetical protein
LNRETELFHVGLANVERQVYSTAAAMAHMNELREQEAGLNIRKEDALLLAERERVLLDNRLNILTKIQKLGEIDAEIAERTLKREIDQQERKIAILEETERRAGKRQEQETKDAEAIKKGIAQEREKTAVVKEEQGIIDRTAQARYELYDKERIALEKITEGRIAGQKDFMLSVGQRMFSGEPIGASDTGLSVEISRSPLYVTDEAKRIAAGRLGEVRRIQQQLAAQRFRAGEAVSEAEQPGKILEKERQFSEGQVLTAEQDIKKAQQDLETERAKLERLKNATVPVLDAQKDAIRTRTLREQLDSVQPQNISVPGGGVGTGNKELLDKLDRLAMQNDVMIQIWTTGSGAAVA